MDIDETKVCTRCKQTLTIDHFWRSGKRNARQAVCKHCQSPRRQGGLPPDARDFRHPLEDVMRMWPQCSA